MSNTKKPNFLRLAGTKSKYGPYLLPDDSVLWELRSADGKYFGDVSYDAYKAVENGTLGSYIPKTDEERRIITEFRQHPGIALKIDGAKAPWRSDFGKISYDGYHALLSGKEGEFTPYTDSEKKAITDFKNYVDRQTGPRSSVAIKTPSGTEDYVTRATADAIARGPLISPDLRSSIGVDRDYVSNYYSQAKKIEDEEKAKERQKRVDSNPTYKRYDIDPAEFTESDLDEWAKEHNFEKKFLPSDAEGSYAGKYDLGYVYVPKREGGFLGFGSKKLTTKQDEEDFEVLFKLVNDRIRQEGIDTDKYVAEQVWFTTKGIGRSFLNTIDDAYMRDLETSKQLASYIKDTNPKFSSERKNYLDEQITTTNKNIKERTTKQAVEGAKLDAKYSHLSEDMRTVGKVIGGSVQVVPLVLTSAINPALGTAVFATQVYGGSLGQALVEGASIKDARTYAGAETTKEILIEKLFGGLPFTKSVSKKFLTPVVNKFLSNPFAREIVKKGADILGEGFEEAASEFISPYIKRAIYDKNAPNATKEELGFAFFSGVVPSMLLNASVAINTVKAYDGLEEKINQYNKWIDVLPKTVRPEYLDAKKTTIDDYNKAVDNMIVASSKYYIQAEKEATEAAVKYFNSEIEKLQKLNSDNAEKQELITGFSRHINANNDYINDLEHQLKELDLIEHGKDDGTLIQKYKSKNSAFKELNPTHIDIAVGANNEKGFVNVTKLSDNTYAVKTVDGNTLYKSDVQFSDRYVELEEANISKKHLEKFLGSDIIKTDDAKSSSTSESKEDDIDGISEAELSLPQKVNEQILKTLQGSDISKGEARIPVENVINLVKYRTEVISGKYRLKPENLYDANLETVSSKDDITITENVKMQYADALAQSIRPNTNLYLELVEISDDVGQFIYDTYKKGTDVQIPTKIDGLMKRFNNIISDVSKTAVDMHRIIYGDVSNNVDGANSTKFVLTGEGTVPKMRVEPSQKDVDSVISAINDTLKQNSLQSLSGYMKKGGNMSDFDELARLLINGYLESGNIGDIGKYFQDSGLTVINAIKRVGGNDYESERIAQERVFRDTSDVERAVGERAQEYSEGISRETGDAQDAASERTTRKQIDDIVYNEVAREVYTEDMAVLESENRAKYGVDTIYYLGHAIDGVGTQLNGFYHKGTLYLQIDDAQLLKSIRDHEITHHFGKSKAYETFRKAVKAKMSVNKFNEWKAEVRLAYGDVLTGYLAKEFEKSGRTLTNEQLQTLVDDYLEEEMMANLNAGTVNFAREYAKEIADFRNGIDMTLNNSNAEVSTESKAGNKPGEYVKQTDAGGDIKYSLSESETGLLYTLDDLKGNAGILYNNGKTIKIPNADMGVLLHAYKTEEHYSNRTDGIIDCISCSGRGDTKHYFYVFYKGEDGRVAPIFRLDYSYLNNYIDEVRKISEELGYDKNEFVNGTQEIHSEYAKIKSERRNGSSGADVVANSESDGRTDRLLPVKRGRSSEEIRNQSQYSERDSFGLSDEQHKRNGDRDSNGRLNKSDKFNDSNAPRRSIVGIKSLTADEEAYNKAVEMDKQGYDIEELWEETGWSKGVDGHFKTELDDSKYEFMMPSTAKENLYIKDFVKHDELFAAYPQIKDIPVLYDENMDDEGEASYLPNMGEHIAGVGELGIIRINPQKSIYELKKSMLHELQHVIQFIEGFEQGTSESYWRQRIKEGYDIGNINDYLQLNVPPAYQLYKDTAGEREARDVVDRMNFTSEQRKNTFPYSMDDSEGVVFADGSSVAAFKKETNQNGVMWTIQQGILDKKEVAVFYSKVSELRNNKYRTFRKSADGDYMFSVDNKLIYTDADYEYPKIKTVITFETNDENLIDYARECFYEGETYGRRFEDTKKIAEIMLGEETIKRADYNPNATDERLSNHSRESESGTTADSRSGEDVRRSIANAQYMETVQKGDMETASKMVEEAAKEAGYNSPKLYHGTRAFGFTEFDISKSDDKRTIFLTSNEKIASTYSGVSGERKISETYNKNIESMSVDDVAKELNKFVKEHYKDTFESADYNYSHYNLEKLNKLISTVNDGLVDLKTEVEQKIVEYADKMALDFDDTTAKTHRQLVSLKEKLDKWDYHNLSTPIYLLIHHTGAFADNSAKYADLEANIRLMNMLRAHQDITDGVVVEESLGRYSIEVMRKSEATEKLKSLSQKGNYALYAKMENPLVIDGKGKNWNEIHNWTSALVPSIDELKLEKEGDSYQLVNNKTGDNIQGAVVPITPAIEKESKEQVISFLRAEALHRFAIKYEGKKSTREIAKIAKENGYDSVLIKNITDNGGQNFNVGMEETADIYVLFDANNAKSADPVTYDDKGNVIPLSERFNEENKDIRFSVKEKWKPDLNKQQLDTLMQKIRHDIKTSENAITDTANWFYTNIGDTDVFSIYSTIYENDPTLLYEIKGRNAIFELDVLKRALEVLESERSIVEKSRIVNELLVGDWLQEKHNMANNNAGLGGRGSNTGHASVLQGKSPEFIGSQAFRNVVKNLLDIQEERNEVKLSVSTETQDRIEAIAKEEVFHEVLTELARKNKQEFISRVRQNEQLQKRLDNAQRQMRLTKVPLADRAKVEKLIKSIVTDMHSVINPRDIHAEVLSIYDEYIAAVKKAGNVPESVQSATDNMVKRFTDVAADIIDNAQEIAVDEDFARLKGWLKNTDIKFPDGAKEEAHFTEFRKKHFGSISLTNDGLPIDMAYNELCEVFPYIFNKSVTAPADQLNAIADALQALKPETYNPHAEYIDDAIEHVVSLFVLEADGISVTKDTRADRLVKKAESQKVTALEKQKEAFQRKYDMHKEKSDEQINKLKEQLKAHSYTQYWERRLSSEEKSAAIKAVRQSQKISMAKAHIRKMVSELKHGLDTTEKSGGIPKELVKAIAEVCSVIDFHTDRTTPGGDATKASLKLDALQVQYDNLKNNPDYDIQSEWHEEISEYIRQLNDTVRNKRVIDLNLMELSALEDILVQIRHTVANAKKQIGIDTAMENREIGMKICEDLNGKEDFIGSTKKMLVKRIGTNVFAANTLNPMRVAEMISGYNRDGEFYKVFRQLNDGVHKGDMFKMDATKPFNLLMEGPGNQALMYDFLTQLHDTDIKDTNGNTVMLPKNMICEVIMLWERKQGRVHLENGGMTIPNIKLFNDGKTQEAYTEGAVRTVAITEWDIMRLRSMLDSYDKAWIDEARILFNEKSQKAINETSLQLVGRAIANAKNYIPIHTDTKFVRTDIEGLKVDATLEGAGSLKAAVENAKQPVLITGLSYSTSEHIDFVAKYHGLAIPIRNFNKVYNVTFADENNTTQSVKDTIGHKWGAKIQKGVIEQTLKDLQTTRNRESDVFNKVMGTIQSNWVGATLNSNPSVALKQLTSYVTASSVLGSTPLVKALPYFANTKATVEEIDHYTGIHFKRRLGYSTQELGDRANRKNGQKLANKARKAMSQYQITAWVNRLPKGFFPTNWMQSVDCRVAAVLWEASKYYVSDTLGVANGSENYWKEVTQIYERTIEETQSNYDTLHKPEVLKSTSEMTRLISMFQNDALQGSGLLWTAFNDWNTKHQNYKIQSTSENKKALEVAQERFKKTAFAQVSSALTLATLTLVARALLRKVKPYKDEEKNKVNAGSISKQVGMDTLENLFTNAVPVLGNLLVSAKDTFVYGYDLASVPTFDTVQNLIDSISGVYGVIDKWDIAAGEDKWNKVRGALNELAISAATAFGIPAQNVINMFNGVKGYVGDIKEGDFFHDINEIIATKRRVFSYADLASAVASGDRKKERKILEYYKNIGVEVKKSSLTTQLKPAYVKCFVDEPEKAHAIRKSLVLRYDYSDDVFNDWIYEAYAKALISDEEYATELKSAARMSKIPFNYEDICSSIGSVYRNLLKENPEEASKIRKKLSKKYGSADFDKWEKDVISKQRKDRDK